MLQQWRWHENGKAVNRDLAPFWMPSDALDEDPKPRATVLPGTPETKSDSRPRRSGQNGSGAAKSTGVATPSPEASASKERRCQFAVGFVGVAWPADEDEKRRREAEALAMERDRAVLDAKAALAERRRAEERARHARARETAQHAAHVRRAEGELEARMTRRALHEMQVGEGRGGGALALWGSRALRALWRRYGGGIVCTSPLAVVLAPDAPSEPFDTSCTCFGQSRPRVGAFRILPLAACVPSIHRSVIPPSTHLPPHAHRSSPNRRRRRIVKRSSWPFAR